MKRVKSACIRQTLVFSQKPDMGYTKEQALQINLEEIKRYKNQLDRSKTRYVIISQEEQEDGSVVVRVKKQYNDKTDVSEYF